MVAKAVLELVISDTGPPPVGGSAPAGASSSAAPAAPRFSVPETPAGKPQEPATPTVPRFSPAQLQPASEVAPAPSVAAVPEAAKLPATPTIARPAENPAQTAAAPPVDPDAKRPDESFSEWQKRFRKKLMEDQKQQIDSMLVQQGLRPRAESAAAEQAEIVAPEGVGGAAAILEGMGGLALKAGAAAAALGAVAAVSTKVGQVMKGLVENAAEFSPEAAAATAQSEIRELRSEMRRSQRIGSDLSQFEDSRSRFESAMTSIGTRVIELLLLILKPLEPILEAIATAIEVQTALGEPVIDALKVLVDFATGQWVDMQADAKALIETLKNLPDRLKDAVDPSDDALIDPFGEQLDKMFDGKPLFGPNNPQPLGI